MNSGASKKQYDHLIKLIIIGDSSVGKSCILLRFSEDHFPTSHMPTIGKCIDAPPYLSQFAALIFSCVENLTATREILNFGKCYEESTHGQPMLPVY